MQSLWHKFSSPARIAVSCRKPLFVLFIAFFASLGISSQALAQSPTPVPTVPATANANSQTDLAQLQAMMGSLDTMLTPSASAGVAAGSSTDSSACCRTEHGGTDGRNAGLERQNRTPMARTADGVAG